MALALVLAATLQRCDTGNTYDMRMCWSRQDAAARDRLHAAYDGVAGEMRTLGIDLRPLAAAQVAWTTARDQTCDFAYLLYADGTIAPQLALECDYRMTQARTQRLTELNAELRARGAGQPEEPVSQAADRELNRIYRLYRARVTPQQSAALAAAELAWISYRDKACAIEGGTCMTQLEKERVTELEAAWVGEPFWM